MRNDFRCEAKGIETRQKDHPEEIRVPLHAIESRIEDKPVTVAEVASIAKRDEGVVCEECVMHRVPEQEGESYGQPEREHGSLFPGEVAGREPPGGADAGVTDWLERPFTATYARARINAWLLRTALRWERAPQPPDESGRLRALHALRILDTPPEAGKNTVLIAHSVTLLYAFGLTNRPEGIAHVFRPSGVGLGRPAYIGMVKPDEWPAYAGLGADAGVDADAEPESHER